MEDEVLYRDTYVSGTLCTQLQFPAQSPQSVFLLFHLISVEQFIFLHL